MREQSKYPREAWFPLIGGLLWLRAGASGGLFSLLLAIAPGVLLVASGGAKLLWPGDRRIAQYAALGSVLGVLLLLPGVFAFGPGSALVLALACVASFLAAGSLALKQEPDVPGVPAPEPSLRLAAQVGADEAILGTMQVSFPVSRSDEAALYLREIEVARELFQARGWLEKPESYHQRPLALEAPSIREENARVRGGRMRFEHLRFESEYEPHPDEPGRERWLGYAPNRDAHAWVLRHRDAERRPWLVCIHGYQMGYPWMDLSAFDPRYYHRELGLNLVLPVLPLHGERKVGRRSGDGYLSANTLDSVHAETQAMWDIRRLLGWVRAQGAPAVGVYGLSLGGYNAALLASLDDDLACAIPGIPATDFARLYWRHGPALQVRFMEHRGVVHDEVAEVLRVVSPLALRPRVPLAHRAIFGGVADRLVPPDQVRDLWEHWERPPMVWYQGAHMTFALEPKVKQLVEATLRGAGLSAA